MVKRSTRSSSSSHSLRRRLGVTMELMMECQEEDLSPSQVEAMRKSRMEYNNAMAQIKEAQNKARLGKATVSIQKTYTPSKLAQPVVNNKPDNTRSSSPDVIIVGESPPKQKTTLSPVAAKPRPGTNVPPPQVVVSRPPQNNVNMNMRNQTPTFLKVIPVTNQPVQYTYTTSSGNNPQNIPIRPSRLIPSTKPPYPQAISQQQQSHVVTPAQQSAANLLWNLQTKRNLENAQEIGGSVRKKQKKADTNDVGNWVPLDEYYYGKMEGDPSYSEEKGEFRFKCWYCSKMLYNNVKAMMHIQGHIDSGKQHNLDLSDLTQCKHCYKQFDTPFEMQTHVEKVHMNGANVLLCRICERDHESRNALTHHMRQNHTACEMPYICQLCNFRSSMYSDVVDHFKKKHDSSQHILCLYCLKVFKVKFVSQGWGQTQTYYGHLLKHQSKTATKKCTLCRLTFYNMPDVKSHKKKDHTANHKGILGTNNKYTTPGQVMIKVPESGLHSKQQNVKSLNAPAVSKVLDFGGTKFPTLVNYLTCLECKMSMGTPDHFKKHIECSMCRFATSCSIAYANHMMGFHSGQMSSLNLNIPWERRMESPMYCLCGFNSKYGNRIANHLVYCTKRTCYRDKQAAVADDGASDEEVADPRRKPGASLLDVLGLVKKRSVATKEQDVEIRRTSKEDDRSIPPFRVNSTSKTKKSSPDAEDSKEETTLPDNADPAADVPPELKGSRKWMTVQIKDKVSPTKASVFLGGKDEEDGGEKETNEGKTDAEIQGTSESPNSLKRDSVEKLQHSEAMEVSQDSQDQSSEVIDNNKPITDDQSKGTDSEQMDYEHDSENDKDDKDLMDDDRDVKLNDKLLKDSEKGDDLLEDDKKSDELLEDNKKDEDLLEDNRNKNELFEDKEIDNDILKDDPSVSKDNMESIYTQKDDNSVFKNDNVEEDINDDDDNDTLTKDEEDELLRDDDKDNEIDNVVHNKKTENEHIEESEKNKISSAEKDEVGKKVDDNVMNENETSEGERQSVAIETDQKEIKSDKNCLDEEQDKEIGQMPENVPEDIVSTAQEKVEESEDEPTGSGSKPCVEQRVVNTDTVSETEKSHDYPVDSGQAISEKPSDHSEHGQDKSDKSDVQSQNSGQDKKEKLADHSRDSVQDKKEKSGVHSQESAQSKRSYDREGRDCDFRSNFSPDSRKDSYHDRNHGDRSHISNYQDRRSHDSRGYNSYDRSRDRYNHGDRSHDYKRLQDNDYHQRDRYYQDRRDNRGYQDNRNYHGNHPYGNRNRDDRKHDGHYDNYNRNQGYYNRGGRGGGYSRGYHGNYR